MARHATASVSPLPGRSAGKSAIAVRLAVAGTSAVGVASCASASAGPRVNVATMPAPANIRFHMVMNSSGISVNRLGGR